MRHEGIAEMMEVGTISHFFSKEIGWIEFSTDMRDHNGTILNPFASHVLSVHESIVAGPDRCRECCIGDGVAI